MAFPISEAESGSMGSRMRNRQRGRFCPCSTFRRMLQPWESISSAALGDALVAEHGSWNRSVPVGRQVVRVRFQGGRPVSATTFLTGVGRPVDVKEAPDGSVLVSDDAGGAIYVFRR